MVNSARSDITMKRHLALISLAAIALQVSEATSDSLLVDRAESRELQYEQKLEETDTNFEAIINFFNSNMLQYSETIAIKELTPGFFDID